MLRAFDGDSVSFALGILRGYGGKENRPHRHVKGIRRHRVRADGDVGQLAGWQYWPAPDYFGFFFSGRSGEKSTFGGSAIASGASQGRYLQAGSGSGGGQHSSTCFCSS